MDNPNTFDIPHYDANDLELIGQNFLKKHLPAPPSIPIDIEFLIQATGIDIAPIDGMFANHRVKGLPVYYAGKAAICIDREHLDKYALFSRFTEAEELSHVLLHSSVYEDCRSLEESIERYLSLDGQDHHIMDRNARYLAGILLMPKEQLRSDISGLLRSADFDIFDLLPDLMGWIKDALARKYVVSPLIMRNRLTNAAFFDLMQTAQETFLKAKKK